MINTNSKYWTGRLDKLQWQQCHNHSLPCFWEGYVFLAFNFNYFLFLFIGAAVLGMGRMVSRAIWIHGLIWKVFFYMVCTICTAFSTYLFVSAIVLMVPKPLASETLKWVWYVLFFCILYPIFIKCWYLFNLHFSLWFFWHQWHFDFLILTLFLLWSTGKILFFNTPFEKFKVWWE